MSAFLLPKPHYDALVQAAIEYGLADLADADVTGADLLRETYRSLDARYGDPVPDVLDYRYEGVEAPLDPAVILAAVASYRYQSCEHGGAYFDSDAERLASRIEKAARDALAAAGDPQAYVDDYIGDPTTGWVLTELVEAVAR